MGPILNLHEVLSWLRRRWQTIAVLAVLGAMAGVVMAMNSERVYTANAVIQVINPVVDVDSGGNAPDVTRRVQIIEQQLMSRDALLELAEQYRLFDGMPLSPIEQVGMMRESFSISAIAAAQQGFTRDGSLSALIVSASDDDPTVAAAIANDFADRLVQQSATDRRSDTQQALEFFIAEENRLETEIAALESEIAIFRSENEQLLPAAAAIQLEERGRLAENLLELQQEISARRSELASLDPDSPRALTRRRVAELNDEIGQYNLQAAVVNDRLREIQSLLQASPEIERELSALNRRMEQFQEQLTNAAERRREAELGARIEVGQQSERFELLERALVPDYPVSTSRKKIAAMGLIAGIMGGLMLAYLMEWLNPVMRTAQRFERDLQLRPVVSIPYEMTSEERRRRQSIWTIGIVILIGGLIAMGGFIAFA